MRFDNLVLSETGTLKDAIEKFQKNHMGIVFIINKKDKVVGVLSDGDIRAALLTGCKLENSVRKYINRNFVYCFQDTPQEHIMKLLDARVHVVPIVDKNFILLDIVYAGKFADPKSYQIFSRAKSPMRISFAGGGTDITQYFIEHGGLVLNATINLYAHASLHRRSDSKITIYSHNLNQKIEACSLEDLNFDGRMDMIKAIIKILSPKFGFDLFLNSDVPPGSGLGGSSSIIAAIIGTFTIFLGEKLDNYDIAEMAFRAERLLANISGGWQDQYATVFGGFNLIEFNIHENIVHPLRINQDIISELEANLVLCFIGNKKNREAIFTEHKDKLSSGKKLKNYSEKIKEYTAEMKSSLLRGRLTDFGNCLDELWKIKKKFSHLISNQKIDQLYDYAKKNGAVGGKLLGAGNGGYFLFYTYRFKRFELENALTKKGFNIQPFTFDSLGLRSWSLRDIK